MLSTRTKKIFFSEKAFIPTLFAVRFLSYPLFFFNFKKNVDNFINVILLLFRQIIDIFPQVIHSYPQSCTQLWISTRVRLMFKVNFLYIVRKIYSK